MPLADRGIKVINKSWKDDSCPKYHEEKLIIYKVDNVIKMYITLINKLRMI